MDQELQFLINTLYGNKLNEKQLAGIIQMAQQNPQYLQNMRNAANAKMPGSKLDMSNIRANNIASQRTPTLGRTDFNHSTANKGIAKNDMSAVDDFKQAFRQARQGGNKTFFWKKTKANPSGMFSTELATSQTSLPENIPVENSQIPVTSIKADMSKTDLPIFKGSRISQGLANALSPKTPEIGTNPYQFDKTQAMVESTKAGLARQFRTNNIPRPMGNPGQNIMGDQYNKNYPYSFKEGGVAPSTGNGSFVDTIIEALNNNTDVQTISSLIQQSGQNPETIIKEIVSRAQGGDQAAAIAFSNLEKLMKNSTVAKLGTKLNYIQRLKGICPEGTEKIYLKNGGCMCAQKAKDGTKTSIKQNKTKMPTEYDEKRHERLAIGEAMGKNNKAQQDSLQTYRKLYNDKSASDKYKMGDQDPHGKNPKKKVQEKGCGGKTQVNRKKKK